MMSNKKKYFPKFSSQFCGKKQSDLQYLVKSRAVTPDAALEILANALQTQVKKNYIS